MDELDKLLEKSGIVTGFNDPDTWVSTGSYALDYIISGRPKEGIPNKRTTFVYGLKSSGKSFTACNIAKNAQAEGYKVLYVDSEDSLNTAYADRIGLDYTDPDKFKLVRVTTLEMLSKFFSLAFRTIPKDKPVCFVVDSLTMMATERELDNFESGQMSSDMGLFAKKAKALVKMINQKIAERDAIAVFINHSYMDQKSMYGGEIPSGGEGILYVPSITIHTKRLQLKEGAEIKGIRVKYTIKKSRFGKEEESVTVDLPWDTGLDPYNGMCDLLCEAGILSKSGGWVKLPDGSKTREKQITPEMYDKLMEELYNGNSDGPGESQGEES